MEHNEIRRLIESDALQLYGQPKWTFGKNTCNTYEVFVEKILMPDGGSMSAWPVMGLIEADESLTVMFSSWFMERAMRSAADLSARTGANMTLSMNLLPLYANREDCPQRVLRLLEMTGLSPKKLQFELSEAQHISEQGVKNLNLLHDEHGIGLLLANFGTGHSNIDLLSDVHFDGLELDRSFARHIPDNEQACRLVIAIVHFAHTLDIYVCAKGIETQDQFEFFEEIGCLKGQGYLIGMPMPVEELKEYMEKYALKHVR